MKTKKIKKISKTLKRELGGKWKHDDNYTWWSDDNRRVERIVNTAGNELQGFDLSMVKPEYTLIDEGGYSLLTFI